MDRLLVIAMLRPVRLAVAICCWNAAFLRGADTRSGRTFTTAQVSIYFETLGTAEGTPLLVANGGPGFDHTYLHLSDAWDVLAKSRKVILYDQRGVGKSSPLAQNVSCSVRDQIEDLEALRREIGTDRIDLLGHSWGGYLAMAYAARYPQHVQHLLLVDSAAPKWSDTEALFKAIFPEGVEREDALSFAIQMGDKSASVASTREYLSMLFYSPEKRDAALAKMTGVDANHTANESINNDLAHYDLNPELPKYRFPVIVMTGRFDINVAPVVAYKIHKAIPGSTYVVFDQSGHLPFYEEEDKFVKTVEGYLK